jgi:putative hydrolase of the HAD superfamily
MKRLRTAETWLFDLDNTLYPAAVDLFAQMDARMRAFIAAELGLDEAAADALRRRYYLEHGTTLNGLMVNHGTAPERYVEYVHDIDLSAIEPDPALNAALARLGGRKIVFTNGSARHAERVLAQLGITRQFEAVFDIREAGYVPKPQTAPYAEVIRRFRVDPRRAVMVDDAARNLAPAAALGMATVWVRTESPHGREGADGPHVHHVADDLAAFLDVVRGTPTAR